MSLTQPAMLGHMAVDNDRCPPTVRRHSPLPIAARPHSPSPLPPPARGGQVCDLAAVLYIDVGMFFLGGHIVENLKENAANGVNSVMPVKTLFHQAIEGFRHDSRVARGDLILRRELRRGPWGFAPAIAGGDDIQ
jgi:hypothetical protein